MDELLIEEKRYISSKRAAKLTGYAKDYIGQLCREGRVPARLVGRSWYVLESAIQDHRFGDPEPKSEAKTPDTQISVWETPHYEAAKNEVLPSINRLRNAAPAAAENQNEVPQPLNESWRAWFDHISSAAVEPAVAEPQIQEEVRESEPEVIEEEQEVNIPIRTIYELPPEDLLPRPTSYQEEEIADEIQEIPAQREGSRGLIKTIQATGAVLALVAVIIAAIGTGYFDTYILSSSQVSLLTGVALYSR